MFLGCHAPNSGLFATRPPKGTSLRQNTRFKLSTMKIGFSVWAVREMKKVKKKKNGGQRYISRMRGGVTPRGGVMKLGTSAETPDVINHAKFH